MLPDLASAVTAEIIRQFREAAELGQEWTPDSGRIVDVVLEALRDADPTDAMVDAWANARFKHPIAGMDDTTVNRLAATADWRALLTAALGEP